MARLVITHPCSDRSSPAYLVLVQGICGNAHATEFTERRSVVFLEVLLLLSNGNGIYRTGPCVCDSEPCVSGTLVMKDRKIYAHASTIVDGACLDMPMPAFSHLSTNTYFLLFIYL